VNSKPTLTPKTHVSDADSPYPGRYPDDEPNRGSGRHRRHAAPIQDWLGQFVTPRVVNGTRYWSLDELDPRLSLVADADLDGALLVSEAA
jgi:hypothetical protein